MLRYKTNTIEYRENLHEALIMDTYFPLTRAEKISLIKWASLGYDIHTNPWQLYDDTDCLIDYISAYRNRYDYYSNEIKVFDQLINY